MSACAAAAPDAVVAVAGESGGTNYDIIRAMKNEIEIPVEWGDTDPAAIKAVCPPDALAAALPVHRSETALTSGPDIGASRSRDRLLTFDTRI